MSFDSASSFQIFLLHGARPRPSHRHSQLPGDLAENPSARLRLLHQRDSVRAALRHHRGLLHQDHDEAPPEGAVYAGLQDRQAEAGGGRQEQEDQQDADRHGGDLRNLLVPDQLDQPGSRYSGPW